MNREPDRPRSDAIPADVTVRVVKRTGHVRLRIGDPQTEERFVVRSDEFAVFERNVDGLRQMAIWAFHPRQRFFNPTTLYRKLREGRKTAFREWPQGKESEHIQIGMDIVDVERTDTNQLKAPTCGAINPNNSVAIFVNGSACRYAIKAWTRSQSADDVLRIVEQILGEEIGVRTASVFSIVDAQPLALPDACIIALDEARRLWPENADGTASAELRAFSRRRSESIIEMARKRSVGIEAVDEFVRALAAAESLAQEPDCDPRCFAACLAAMCDLGARKGKLPGSVYSRILTLVRRWLNGDASVITYGQIRKINLQNLRATPTGRQRFRRLGELLVHAPWLVWWTEGHHPELGSFRIRGDLQTIATALVLARPTARLQGSLPEFTDETRVAPRNPWDVLAPDEVGRVGNPSEWADACAAAGDAWNDPSFALHSASSCGPLGAELRGVLAHRLGEVGLEHAAIRWDHATASNRVVVINRSRSIVELAVDDSEQQDLLPMELFRRSGGWVSEPKTVDALHALFAGHPIDSDAPTSRQLSSPRNDLGSETTPLFTGRAEEMDLLLAQMKPEAEHRIPALVWGNRRAGKSTLAWQALKRAKSEGLIATGVFFDVYSQVASLPDSEAERALVAKIARELARASNDLGPCELPPLQPDLIRYLEDLDDALDRTIGVVLDEFDALLWRPSESPLSVLLRRLAGARWSNIALIGTAQRFSADFALLKGWNSVQVQSDLGWPDALRYFAPSLLDEAPEAVLSELTLHPRSIDQQVIARIGFRPTLWSGLYQRLDSQFRVRDSWAMPTDEEIARCLDETMSTQAWVRLPLQPTRDLPRWEQLRQDLFSVGERKVLALFASGRQTVPREEALVVADGHAVDELVAREWLEGSNSSGTSLKLAVPAAGEVLARHRYELVSLIEEEEAAPDA